ncbi:hypothetical protein EHQ81_08725 [Leptospira selangorensis]|uniref:Uncharacterized protein n=1 Tax=Leptospira selangorensis TaxID=2484982 RepID=A0A4R9FNB3_9LEPT|nr:hypothetical protein [Leptospira selangorensis]TGJ99953.1 hypothetical protein EHO58_19260 [Leptospira selangorensis]TGM13846.1 hypothetical protein EHQ81_08725 [Leptospira selangorensis]TGM27221.1 hypothetical protein EHQ82_04295 [Leptospira selangorensis]
MVRKLKRAKDKFPDIPDSGEMKKIIFHSILSYLSKQDGHVSKMEIKDLLFDAISLIPGFRVEWGEIQKFGKSKLLVNYKDKLLILDLEEISNMILKLWDHYLDTHPHHKPHK